MSDDFPAPGGEPQQPTCEKCGGHLEHMTRLPQRFDHSAFDIFRCVACGYINWVALKDE